MSYLLTINRENQKMGEKSPQNETYQKTVDNSIVKKHLKTCCLAENHPQLPKVGIKPGQDYMRFHSDRPAEDADYYNS